MSKSKPTIFIHLHTLDLRIHDSPSLHLAHSPNSSISKSITHFLPVYILDERQLDLSSFSNTTKPLSPYWNDGSDEGKNWRRSRAAPTSRVAGFYRTSPFKLHFLLQSIFGLKESYRRSGGDLLIGYGRPEILVPSLIRQLEETHAITGVWAQEDPNVEEKTVLSNLERALALGKQGVKLEKHDSKPLIPASHLPFKVEDLPDVYTEFRKRCEGLGLGLGSDGGMLVKPLKTASWDIKTGRDLIVDVEGQKLKPFPQLQLDKLELDQGKGGWLSPALDSLEEVYSKLAKPLLDSPPPGGWPSSIAQNPTSPPHLNQLSAIPFKGDESSALARLDEYVGHPTAGGGWKGGGKAKKYKATRNGMLGEGFSTKFSIWLSTGAISAREVGWRVGGLLDDVGKNKDQRNNVYWIIFELLWRDFFHHLTTHYSLSSTSSLFIPEGFSSLIPNFPSQRPNPSSWHSPDLTNPQDPGRKWIEGNTGVPFIDASMRELRETGWMSNRGRQNVASFLVKDLGVDWRFGAEWFEMWLVDYDTCSNWGNWQYQAGVGNDPRTSRQFNPIKQARDYDPSNEFVKAWIPELKNIPDELIQTPWLMNDKAKLGGYPERPIIEQPQWRKFYPGGERHGDNRGGRGRGGGYGDRSWRGRGRGQSTNQSEGGRDT